jgi:fibronectin-binding autotransporter adhesin
MNQPTTRSRRDPTTVRARAALPWRRASTVAAALTVGLAQGRFATAATLSWDPSKTPTTPSGGTGTWDTGTTPDWSNLSTDVTWTDTTGSNTAVFGGAAGTVTLAGTETANRVVFNTSGYLLTGGTLNLAGTTPTITTNANAEVDSVISGSAGLTKAGTGTLTLTNTETYTGATTINAGTLAYSLGAGTLTLPSGSGLSGAGSLSVSSYNTTFTGNVTLGGSQSYNSLDTNSHYLLSTDTTLTGSAVTISGAIGENGPGSSHLFAIDTSAANGPINLNLGFTVTNVYYPIGSFSANAGTGSLTLTNTTGYTTSLTSLSLTGALTVNDSVPQPGNFSLHATGNSTVAGQFGLEQSHAYYAYSPFTVDAGSTMTVSAELDGVSGVSYGGFSKLGGGTLVLTNANNTYGQGVDLTGGTLQFTNNALKAASSGAGNGGYAVDFIGNSTLKFDATDTTDISTGGQIDIANGVTASFDTNGSTQTFGTAFALKSGTGAAVVLTDTAATPGTLIIAANNTYTGGTTITRGTLQVGNGGSAGSLGTGAVVDNGTLGFNRSSVTLPVAAGLSGTGNLSVVSPSTTFAGNVTLGGSQTYNPGNASAMYALSTSVTLTGSALSITGEAGQPAANSGDTLALDTSAANGPITVNLGFSVPNVSYTLGGFTANAGTGALTVTNTTTSANFPAAVSLTGALNINDTIADAQSLALHATANSTVAGSIGLDQADPVTTYYGNNTFTVDAGATMTVSAQLTGVANKSFGGISKLGAGTLVLSNPNNSYANGTVISAGTVRAEAATASLGTGPVTVSGGTLAGSGNTGSGTVTLSGGTLTAGTGATAADRIGALAIGSGGLTLDGGTYVVKLNLAGATPASTGSGTSVNATTGGIASDQLLVYGTLAAGTSNALVVSPLALSSTAVNGTTYSFVIIDAQGSNNLGAFDYSIGQLSVTPTDAHGNQYALTIGYDNSGGEELLLDVTAVAYAPEPTSLLLVGLAAMPLALGRRRRSSLSELV